jgi:hypothetical protein
MKPLTNIIMKLKHNNILATIFYTLVMASIFIGLILIFTYIMAVKVDFIYNQF